VIELLFAQSKQVGITNVDLDGSQQLILGSISKTHRGTLANVTCIDAINGNHMKSEDTAVGPSLGGSDSPALFWPATLAFLIASPISFAWLFEWDRYQIITAYRLRTLCILDQVLVFWLLVAKSLSWFLPLLLAWGALMALGLTRTALLVLNCFWIGIFYFMAVDLVSVNNVGYHAWKYWLPVWEIRVRHGLRTKR
jgi:hypothetical protein